MRIIIGFLMLLIVWSCAKSVRQAPAKQLLDPPATVVKRISPPVKEVKVHLQSIKAVNLQERITFYDELLLQVAIVRIVGDRVFPIDSKVVYLGKASQGQVIGLDTMRLKSVFLHPGERVGVQIALWELDDYAKDLAFVNKLNQVSGFVQIPMALFEWSSFSNPVSWFIWGARLSGFGLDWWSKRDLKDLLGVSELQWDYVDMTKGRLVRYKRGNWKGGTRGLGAYQYGFAYTVVVNDSLR
jgi:hypothetical protein